MNPRSSRAAALAAFAFLSLTAPGQMEKRFFGEYDAWEFNKARPALGERVPDLTLCDTDGRPWSLRDLLGRTIVLVKGSYT